MPILPPRPTTEFTLKNGWKVSLVDFFTQGEYDEIMRTMLDTYQYDPETKMLKGVKASTSIDQTHVVKKMAVKKLTAPDGTIFENEAVTLDVILAMPYVATDELKVLIDQHCYGKKKEETTG